ncbi:MAG: hypothetical protein U0175_14065 [Caldilineaceae bacterium]
MNNFVTVTQNRRWLVWAALTVATLIAASSPWFAVVAHACIGQGGGC